MNRVLIKNSRWVFLGRGGEFDCGPAFCPGGGDDLVKETSAEVGALGAVEALS